MLIWERTRIKACLDLKLSKQNKTAITKGYFFRNIFIKNRQLNVHIHMLYQSRGALVV